MDLTLTLVSLVTLEWLWLYDSMLTGTIPSEIGSHSQDFVVLTLMNNLLTGTIPTEIAGLPNMTDLWLEGNLLTGTIPTEIGMATNLSEYQIFVLSDMCGIDHY